MALASAALGVGAALGTGSCGEDRPGVEVEGGTGTGETGPGRTGTTGTGERTAPGERTGTETAPP